MAEQHNRPSAELNHMKGDAVRGDVVLLHACLPIMAGDDRWDRFIPHLGCATLQPDPVTTKPCRSAF